MDEAKLDFALILGAFAATLLVGGLLVLALYANS